MSEIRHTARAAIRHTPVATTASRELPGGTGTGPHHHDEHQIVYASSGVLSVSTDAGVWVTPASRAIWIPAGAIHEPRAYGRTVLTTVGLQSANPLRLSQPTVLAVSPLLRELLIAYAEGGATETATAETAAAETAAAGSPERRRLRAVLLDQLRLATAAQPLHIPAPRDPRLADAAAALDADPARSLPEVAAAAGASGRTLSRLCRDELGMTFPQWRTQVRLHLALRLLAEGESVTAVAMRCGWSTPSAFVDVFRRVLGYTPGRGR
ncbi:AraC family transcriptional regulator [Streptomyces sp. A7024]|uniref:HTH-type transcriptional regulator RipA n=1 Tax=Streptomyces coryli TaxID=1128680 RepID=A0A6G4UEQ4_9ACTN|nr:helix-turn-helix transcriptional regulator [Streptomyces coryli]NGN70098.1 AraC family transcriptional regulator [Streptomyces coryli]